MRWQGLLGTAGPVPVLNDAHAALLGEVWQGAAQGCEHAILLTLGTGVGGAAWMDGRLLRGHLGRAGHFGHISLDPKGALGITNAPGCLEYAIGQCTLNDRSDGKFATTRELVSAFEAGDAVARSIWLASIESLAAGIISLVNVLDPEVVILGGGISQAGKSLFEPLREYMDRFEWRPGGAQVRVMPAKLGNRAGAIGAAWHAMGFSEPV
jgi:glucokinase